MLSLLYQEPETGPKVNCLKDLNLIKSLLPSSVKRSVIMFSASWNGRRTQITLFTVKISAKIYTNPTVSGTDRNLQELYSC